MTKMGNSKQLNTKGLEHWKFEFKYCLGFRVLKLGFYQ